MNQGIVVGTITLPYSLSDKERLLWLEDWMYECSEGILINRSIDVVFTNRKAIEDSMEYLMKDDVWKYINDSKFLAPNGIVVNMIYDEEGDRILTAARKMYRND